MRTTSSLALFCLVLGCTPIARFGDDTDVDKDTDDTDDTEDTVDTADTDDLLDTAVGPTWDHTFLVDFGQGTIVEPPIISLVPIKIDTKFLVGTTDPADTAISMIAAIADEATTPPQQDVCVPSVDLDPTNYGNAPYFDAEIDQMEMYVSGIEVKVMAGQMVGTFNQPNYDGISDLEMEGEVDTRPLVNYVSPGGPPEAVCDLLASLGVSCLDCPDGSGFYCVHVRIESLTGHGVPGPDVIEVSQADVDANP
ncbi:MAG: hypothetical protein HN348_36870, partial [Proteobacteria bacterium]|nr:hypothetical protein [Pseudomonadota bacterium]